MFPLYPGAGFINILHNCALIILHDLFVARICVPSGQFMGNLNSGYNARMRLFSYFAQVRVE